MSEREQMLLQFMNLAKDIGVEFTFPIRTLHVETAFQFRGSGARVCVGCLRPENKSSPARNRMIKVIEV